MKKLFVLFAAVALVCFTVPATAVDWNFFGSARMATYWVDDEFGDGENAAETGDDDADLQWDFQSNSRIGAKVKADAVDGFFELGLKGNGAGDLDVGTRRLYGEWDFGAGYLRVGKDYTPISQFISGQVFDGDLGLLGYGTMYGNRTGQIALGFGGFEIAFITPNSQELTNFSDIDGDGVIDENSSDGDVDEYFPKVEAKWGMSMDAFDFAIRGGFQTYTIEDVESLENPGDTNDVDVTSWIVGADLGFNLGPAYVKGAASYGENVGNAAWNIPGNTYGHGGAEFVTGNGYWDGDDDMDDTTTWMAALVAGFKMTDMLTFEAGGGWRNDDPDLDGADETDVWAVYGQAVIGMAPGVWIIPEVGYYEFDEDSLGDDAGSRWYAGAKWQIDF